MFGKNKKIRYEIEEIKKELKVQNNKLTNLYEIVKKIVK